MIFEIIKASNITNWGAIPLAPPLPLGVWKQLYRISEEKKFRETKHQFGEAFRFNEGEEWWKEDYILLKYSKPERLVEHFRDSIYHFVIDPVTQGQVTDFVKFLTWAEGPAKVLLEKAFSYMQYKVNIQLECVGKKKITKYKTEEKTCFIYGHGKKTASRVLNPTFGKTHLI